MTISNRDVLVMDRHAEAMREFTEAVNSNAGKLLREERLLLEKTHGGVKRLEKAQAILDNASGEAKAIVDKALAKEKEIAERTRNSVAEAQKALDLRYEEMRKKTQDFKQRENALLEAEQSLSDRENECKSLEKVLQAREALLKRMEENLEADKAQLEEREKTLNERRERILAAIN